jgi:hypothetical protein
VTELAYSDGPPRPAGNVARGVWIAVGAVLLLVGMFILGLPTVAAIFNSSYLDGDRAFLIALLADLVLIVAYIAGIVVLRRDATGRLRTAPPALAAAAIVSFTLVALILILVLSARPAT